MPDNNDNNTNITFKENDKLNRLDLAMQIEGILQHEKLYGLKDESCVISLHGEFGTGKSYFLHMLYDKLTTDAQDPKPHVIQINSWEDDFHDEPLIVIMAEIHDQLINSPIDEKRKEFLSKAFTAVNLLIKLNTGFDLQKIGENIFKKAEEDTPLTEYKKQKNLKENIKNALNKLFDERNPLIIIIDELDRCKPDYAVLFLERLKHFFHNKHITFIIAVNKTQLSSSVKCLFGQETDFDEYYRKFAQHRLSLPDIKPERYNDIYSYIKYKLKEYKLKNSYEYSDTELTKTITDLSVNASLIYLLSLREINQMLHSLIKTFEAAPYLKSSDTLDRLNPSAIMYILITIITFLSRKKDECQKILDNYNQRNHAIQKEKIFEDGFNNVRNKIVPKEYTDQTYDQITYDYFLDRYDSFLKLQNKGQNS